MLKVYIPLWVISFGGVMSAMGLGNPLSLLLFLTAQLICHFLIMKELRM